VTIAAIDGGCAGAGFGWATACDLRIATPRAVFSTAFLKVGASGDMGLPWLLTRLLGAAKARELIFLPDKFDAATAHAMGLISEITNETDLMERAVTLAKKISVFPAFALKMMKANILSAERVDFHEYIEIESARHMHVAASPSLREGFRSFLKRDPPGRT
jgi:2-(1,2-epoxy-1,2-dihydrophenyl)acetyl-CoA isomerase